MSRNKIQKILIVVLTLGMSFLYYPKTNVHAQIDTHSFPRKANYFLSWSMTDAQAVELAKWDLLILDMENQITSPQLLKKIRSINKDIVILAYITPQEIFDPSVRQYSTMRKKLAGGLHEDWYLKNNNGTHVSLWANTKILNISSECPIINGQQLNEYIAQFVTKEVLSTGYWDGVFYDNAWDTLTHFAGTNVAISNGQPNALSVDTAWRAGMKVLYDKTRSFAPKNTVIVGNAPTTQYKDTLNGNMIESFTQEDWVSRMDVYKQNSRTVTPDPRVNIINANTGNTNAQFDYRNMRYGLTSALLEDGYYSFDYGNQNHGQTWWYDEYAINLGKPSGYAVSKLNYNSYIPDIWMRNFEQGISVVNSSQNTQKVALGGEYEKIHGTQDIKTNDGSIVSELSIEPEDGLILLRTFETLQNVIFTNGAFARFFRPDGSRVRNGFFVFEETYKGGVQIAHIDLDGNNKPELIVFTNTKMEVWRDDGIKYLRVHPFTANYTGTLKVAIGDIDENGRKEIFVAPSKGHAGPIKIYNRYGGMLHEDFYPFGKDYAGGYSLAIGDVDGKLNTELIVGRGGDKTEVAVFGRDYKLKYAWKPFESSFLGGVTVAVGSVDGDYIDEIIVGRREGKPEIKVFNAKGTLLHKQFSAYDTFGNPGIDVRALDLDFDGKDDIIGLSDDAF
ncbi:MAG: hypothetical protein HYV41_02020 [Candidatus Magasanikbacteria bacterium]|nr:hypothetical protein [Candidatus Magasanikbacteria bacterium]